MRDKSQILNDIKEYYNFKTDAEFARFLGITPQNLSKWNERKTFDVDVLFRKCTKISTEFLLSGKGNIERTEVPTCSDEKNYLIPILPISAQGGSFDDMVSSIRIGECEKILSPIKEVDFAIRVSGDSMQPEYPSGSIVLIKRVDENQFLEWGRCYVLNTSNGDVIKELRPSEREGYVRCFSVNPDQSKYAPFEVALSEVYGIYRVRMLLTEK